MSMKQKKLFINILVRFAIAGFFVGAALLHWSAVFHSMPNGSWAIVPAFLFSVASVVFIGEEIL